MGIKEMREILVLHDKSIIDVAAATKLDPTTVRRFLMGFKGHKTTKILVELYIRSLKGVANDKAG